MNVADWPVPERDDEANARRWRGCLFHKLAAGLVWKDKATGCYEMLRAPASVTFPICEACGHVIWDWPHFEEPVPKQAICETWRILSRRLTPKRLLAGLYFGPPEGVICSRSASRAKLSTRFQSMPPRQRQI